MKYRFEIKIYFYMKPLTLSDLRTRQAWPLNQKIDHTCYAMETFVAYCKEHDRTPYVSFSGGLNSTVLLDLARRFVDPNMKGVFCSTGNEYPEIVRFVRHTDNIEIIHPAMPPREVMARYGFPLVSKEQAQAVRNIRTTNSDKLRTYRLYGDGVRRAGVLSEKWRYLISEPYMTSEKCCEILKKRPPRLVTAEADGEELPSFIRLEDETLVYEIYPEDTPMLVQIKEFMALYGLVDIRMRMLRIPELKRIMGFPENYVLIGTQEEQKKFIGNAVEVNMARVLCEALVAKLYELNIVPQRFAA